NNGSRFRAELDLQSTIHLIPALMAPLQLPNLTEGSPVIRVAIVCGPETTVLANSLEALLAAAKGFAFSRFEYRAESGLKPNPTGLDNSDVVVAALDSF